jgi:hypothetical protein
MSLTIRKPYEYGPLDLKGLEDFENDNQIIIPDDYRHFLKRTNGRIPLYNAEMHELNGSIPQVAQFYGFHESSDFSSIYDALESYSGRIPSWYFPIAKDHAGNLFLMSLFKDNYGLIAFWDHEGENLEGNAEQHFDNMKIIADNFTEFRNMF